MQWVKTYNFYIQLNSGDFPMENKTNNTNDFYDSFWFLTLWYI